MPPKATKKNPTASKAAAKRKPKPKNFFASKVGNGVTLFIDGALDQRSIPARRFREVVYSIGSDLGGFDSLSEFQKQLTRRSAALSVLCELDECKLAKGEDIDAARFGAMVNSLNRLGQTLGVRREVIDLQPSLKEILAAKVAERPQEAAEDEEEGEAANGRGLRENRPQWPPRQALSYLARCDG